MGAWNIRGINGIAKIDKVVDILRMGKFELLALTETKIKGNGYRMNGIIEVVQQIEMARSGVAVLMNDKWHRTVTDIQCVSSRIS